MSFISKEVEIKTQDQNKGAIVERLLIMKVML